ncbi:MAG TPA: CPBP family glutamic-type intramembrane protease [Candidatus Dormibacteraeota bacterium]
MASPQALRIERTGVARSLRWMRVDAPLRLLPFAALYAVVVAIWHPRWAGWSVGWACWQLAAGVAGGVLLFIAAALVQLRLTRRRGGLRVPADLRDLGLQTAFYAVNGPLEEAFFRGLVQGGLGALTGLPVAGFAVATAAYVLYHRLGAWTWPDVFATALAGIPLGLAFWLLPGPPSLLAVAIAHIGATCGFLGPGPWLLYRVGLLRPAA